MATPTTAEGIRMLQQAAEKATRRIIAEHASHQREMMDMLFGMVGVDTRRHPHTDDMLQMLVDLDIEPSRRFDLRIAVPAVFGMDLARSESTTSVVWMDSFSRIHVDPVPDFYRW